MAINLLDVKPHQVSRDLSGYITFLYGPPKVGKTTFGSQMPGHIILAFEKGYNALPGVMAIDVTTWGEMKTLLRDFKKPEVKERYQSIIVDTADVAAEACQKYICNQLGIENIGDGGWSTNGWAKYKKEFEETFRTLTQLGYAVVFISHEKEKTIKPKEGEEYQQIGSSIQSSAMSIIENMSDIIGYAHPIVDHNGEHKRVLTLRSTDNNIRCGCRFRYIEPEIEFSYQSLTRALNAAIDKEATMTGGQFVTNEREEVIAPTEYDYDALRLEFAQITDGLIAKDPNYYTPKIVSVIEKYLGKGKKVGDTTPDQAEFIFLINNEIKDDLLNK